MNHDVQERSNNEPEDPHEGDADDEHPSEATEAIEESGAPGPSPLGVLVALTAFMFPILWVPTLLVESWSARFAVHLMLTVAGLPALVALAWSSPHQRAARAAAAFAIVAFLSAGFSANPTIGYFGNYGESNGALFLLGLTCAWALGASIGPGDRPLVLRCLSAGVVLSLAVGVLQAGVDLGFLNLHRGPGGRVGGLLGNPVHLGSLGAGTVALGIALLLQRGWIGVGLVALGAGAVAVAGGRASLMVAISGILVASFRRRFAMAALAVLAIAAGTVLGGVLTAQSGAPTALGRISDNLEVASNGGSVASYRYRAQVWMSARYPVLEAPVLGVGPAQFRAATSRFHTKEQARSLGAEALFTDAHNLVAEYAATIGMLGLACFVAWIVFSVHGASGPLLWFGLATLAGHLFQPASRATMVPAMLAIGAAANRWPTHRPRIGRAVGAMAVLGLVPASIFLVGDSALRDAALDYDLAAAERANRLLPRWPFTAGIAATVVSFDARVRKIEELRPLAQRWRAEAIRRDPSDARQWYLQGHELLSDGDVVGAERSYREVLRRNPMSAEAAFGLGRVANARGDREAAIEWFQLALDRSPGNVNYSTFLRLTLAGEAAVDPTLAPPFPGANAPAFPSPSGE